jgi:SAM-dependent methyltransferase
MIATAHADHQPHPFHGVTQIVRFNWPFYAIGAPAALAAVLTIPRLSASAGAELLMYSAVALGWLWLVGSLAVSWLVYDRSILMAGHWIPRELGFPPTRWIHIHAGLDSMTRALRKVLGGAPGRVFDMFDAASMTEPSIRRARANAASSAPSEPVDYRSLPVDTESVDLVVLPLSAHELRTHAARRALFEEVRRGLTAGGRVVVAEHLRDWPNFIAFGPGAFHFHSRRAWKRCFTDAGLAIHREFSITPFVHVFILRRSA